MKKIFLLPLIFGLVACDNSGTYVELTCGRAYKDTETKVKAKIFDNHVLLRINDGDAFNLKKEKNDQTNSVINKKFNYKGVYPETDKNVWFSFILNTVDSTTVDYKIHFDDTDSWWACDVVTKFHGKYEKPSKEEICIERIVQNIFLPSHVTEPRGPLYISRNVNEYTGAMQSVKFYNETLEIPQTDALGISKNWDYNNMKVYNNADGFQEYEKDACAVANALDAYIKSTGFDKTHFVFKLNKDSLAKFRDSSFLNNKELPSPQELGDGVLDIASVDCSDKDLSGYDATRISFDTKTKFPTDTNKLPKNFDNVHISESSLNPGLGVRRLHEMGIDGRGMSIAIIDQKLSPHYEYIDNLTWYEEIGPNVVGPEGTMHGAAVSSIAVGKTVGVAPGAKLYYFAAENVTDWNAPRDNITTKYYVRALNRILDINEKLPDNEKIAVVSVSWDPVDSGAKDPELWRNVLKRAKQEGVFVTTTGIGDEYGLFDGGLNRDIYTDFDDASAYSQGFWQIGENPDVETQKKTLCFPMDHRTTAGPNGYNDYAHYANGGWSWVKPYEAGMYALAKQVNSNITPEEFFRVGLETGIYSEKAKCVIVNPIGLINALRQ